MKYNITQKLISSTFLILFSLLVMVQASSQQPGLDVEGTVIITNHIDDGFEDNFIDPFTTSGGAPWVVQGVQYHAGTKAAVSGGIVDNQSSTISYALTVTESATLSFWVKVSSEENFDFLAFDVNGLEKMSISGEIDWRKYSFPLTEGVQTLNWKYSKDVSNSIGMDAGWLDDVVITFYDGHTVRIQDGTQALGKVLSSDEAGYARWTSLNEILAKNTELPIIAKNSPSDGFQGISNSADGFYAFDNSAFGFRANSNANDGFSSNANTGDGYQASTNSAYGFHSNTNSGGGFLAESNTGDGFRALSNSADGFYAFGNSIVGFRASSNASDGFSSNLNTGDGFHATSNTAFGFHSNTNSGGGFLAESNTGDGFRALSNTGDGFYAFDNAAVGFRANSNDQDGFSSNNNAQNGYFASLNDSSGFVANDNDKFGFLATMNDRSGFVSSYNGAYGYYANNNVDGGFISYDNDSSGFVALDNDHFGYLALSNDRSGFVSSTNGVYGFYADNNVLDGYVAISNEVDGFYSIDNGINGFNSISNVMDGYKATSNGRYGVYSIDNTDDEGYFAGTVTVTGSLSKGSGSFKIDHPLDPENKYLYHSFVESPDMMNVYNGNIILDDDGEATITMPEWFDVLNREFRYQLTSIGAPGPNLYIAKKMDNNSFSIAGGQAGSEVSWQITGIRQDPFAEQNRIQVEVEKEEKYKGKYIHNEEYGQPFEKGHEYVNLNNKTLEEIKSESEKRKSSEIID